MAFKKSKHSVNQSGVGSVKGRRTISQAGATA